MRHLPRVLASILLVLPLAGARATLPFVTGYDMEEHEGLVIAIDPDGDGQVLHRRAGRIVEETLPVEVEGREGWLLLWKGFPRSEERYPELWVLDEGPSLRMVWPPDAEFYWLAPEVTTGKDPGNGEARLEVRRLLPPPLLIGRPAFTRETLRLSLGGVTLAEKGFEPWRSERQLAAIVEDLLVLGEVARVPEVLAWHQRENGPLGDQVLRHLAGMAYRTARALGVPAGPLEEAVAPLRDRPTPPADSREEPIAPR